ncbi:GNAT family N-acetyltransferase [Streptomyces sp. NPDC006326]|uniref:GNAT family N-acetyltransferase n=1 Tax=Streptomyces sp. NPDC006326 TaxID=3156752 RepID=UPI0033A74212
MSGAELLARQDGIRRVHTEAFAEPPWNEDGRATERFLQRVTDAAPRPGLVAALAFDGAAVIGLATACPTPPPQFPSGRCYPQVAATLRAEAARGRGVGAALLDAVTADAPGDRC